MAFLTTCFAAQNSSGSNFQPIGWLVGVAGPMSSPYYNYVFSYSMSDSSHADVKVNNNGCMYQCIINPITVTYWDSDAGKQKTVTVDKLKSFSFSVKGEGDIEVNAVTVGKQSEGTFEFIQH
ncbi:MAG: hypothetical protein KJ588_02005 [Gammaproteobacteria bacterium]|nr:hypothetical protein [Gammaproteobacteria bacterium]